MKYINSNAAREQLYIKQAPRNMQEAYNKLICLMQLERRFDPNANAFTVKKPSKRRERLVKMFWAFKRAEAAANG